MEKTKLIMKKKVKAKGISALDRQEGGDHYKDMAIQPAIYCRANKMQGLESSVVRYVSRHGKKDGIDGGKKDIKKAIHCLEMILEMDYDS